ncbi:hypothetical protein ESP47_07225 [Heyndrickxia coagulans]|nr:hypothetical protein CIW84_06620 [Heyndrickxia coagulans]AWP37547.1 hypothetical protein CYJ15_11285 [Heyndrickxia coagulans]QAU26912.1 hypothetical protein ESP47_07225 [Heyndrickxia coagulans]QDI63047.1 hypothetical protein DXF96_16820 [Heyndrickxia coagulans]RCS32830.1 hypothetical protein DN050_05825 [Heyndrickxia coagulans]
MKDSSRGCDLLNVLHRVDERQNAGAATSKMSFIRLMKDKMRVGLSIWRSVSFFLRSATWGSD